MDQLIDQKTAAKLLCLSVRTLERHRVAGTGPRFARLGRLIRYRQRDLEEFVGSNLRNSTSEMPRHHLRTTAPGGAMNDLKKQQHEKEGQDVADTDLITRLLTQK